MKNALIFWLILCLLLLIVFYFLSEMLLPFIVAFVFSYFLNPIVDKMSKFKIPRMLNAFIVVSGVLFAIILFMMKIVPHIIIQFKSMLIELPKYQKIVITKAQEYSKEIETLFNLGNSFKLNKYLDMMVDVIFSNVNQTINNLWYSGVHIAYALSLFFITPIITFYILNDWHKIQNAVINFLPIDVKAKFTTLFRSIDGALSQYIRGQINVCLIIAFLYSVALYVVGLDFALLIGTISGLLVFIPYLGFAVGLSSALVVSYIQFQDFYHLLLVVTIYVVGQILEGSIITPYLVGDRIGIHPVWLIFLVMAGGQCFGFLGVILSVPIGAMIAVIIRSLFSLYFQSKYYNSKLKKS